MVRTPDPEAPPAGEEPPAFLKGRKGEITVFTFLAVVLWPVVAVAVVGAFGFAIWMSQLVLGPPGPPG